MRTVIKGKIENFVPFFNGLVDENGMLIFKEDGNLSFTVDTGFNGAVALPEEILDKMDVELAHFGIFRLATGDEVELPIFWGKVMVGNLEIETWFIPGDSLLGMEFLSSAGSRLSFDFDKEVVKLLK